MLQLEQLVRNQHFLVTVIDTMERQKDFSVRDRSVGRILSAASGYSPGILCSFFAICVLSLQTSVESSVKEARFLPEYRNIG